MESESLWALEEHDGSRIHNHGKVVGCEQSGHGDVDEVAEEPSTTWNYKCEKYEPGPLPKFVVHELDRDLWVEEDPILIIPIGSIPLLISTIPIVSFEWIIFLILIVAYWISAGLVIVEAKVALLIRPVRIGEPAAVGAGATGDCAAALELVVEVATSQNNLVILLRLNSTPLNRNQRHKSR